MARRSGAKPGDALIVTNTLGDSRAGLELLLKLGLESARRTGALVVERHLKCEPRIAEARAAVATGKVHSMMDVSDGLASDLGKLCEASGVGARVLADRIPISRELHVAAERLDANPVHLAAAGRRGLRTAPHMRIPGLRLGHIRDRVHGIQGKRNRRDRRGGAVVLVNSAGQDEPMPKGWEHF